MRSGPDNTLVTVYVTNHNYGRFLAQAVDSVLAQTLQNVEIIIIDDGSTDHSREVIETYAHRSGVQIIYQQQKGLNVTNNIALRVARGKYIMRLDADDWLNRDALLLMSNALERDPELGLIFPDYYLVDATGNMLGLEHRHSFEKDVSLLDQPAHGACTMIRRKFLLDLGGYDESFACQDGYDLWLKFIAHHKVENINLPLFCYRQHGNNLTRNENRILSTRSEIKRAHAVRGKTQINAMGVIAVRGKSVDPSSIAMEPLGNKLIIDWLIEACTSASTLQTVVVTSSDPEVERHVKARYSAAPKLLWRERPEDISRLNVDIQHTLHYLQDDEVVRAQSSEVVVMVSEKYPFVRDRDLDDAVHTMALFDVDKVLSVRPETAMLYQHNGHGLHMILDQGRFTRLEREALYRSTGGITAFRFSQLAKREDAQRIGHIVVDQHAAQGINSEYDMRIARMLASSA